MAAVVAYPPAWPVIAEAVGWLVGAVAAAFGAKVAGDQISAMMSESADSAEEADEKAGEEEGEEAESSCKDCGNGDDPPPKKKASGSKPGEKVRTPDTHPEDFSKNRSGQYTNRRTGEVWEKSHTRHSGGPEWKVGSRPGIGPRPSSKITVRGGTAERGGGTIIKID